jgi:hypothetical protein
MKLSITPLIICLTLFLVSAKAQTKLVGECALQYLILQDQDTIGSKRVLIKGDQCKTVLTTKQLTQTLYFNKQDTIATITKEMGNTKFLQQLKFPQVSALKVLSINELTNIDSLMVLGYLCKGMQVMMSDSSYYQLWYTPQIATTVNTFESIFENIPGLVLSYIVFPIKGKPIQYNATSVDLSPIALSQFYINKENFQLID